MLPGDFLKSLIYHATRGQVAHGLGCQAFREWMNALGWLGCWRERRRILARIRQQGAAEGYSTSWPALAGHTLAAAWWRLIDGPAEQSLPGRI